MDCIHNLTSIPSMFISHNHKKLLNYLDIDDRINNFLVYAYSYIARLQRRQGLYLDLKVYLLDMQIADPNQLIGMSCTYNQSQVNSNTLHYLSRLYVFETRTQ